MKYSGTPEDLKLFCERNSLTPLVCHIEGESIDNLDLKDQGVCIILGNEYSGPNAKIFEFSKRISLPMHPFMNSLNVSIAGGIIIHQIQGILKHGVH